MKLHYGMRFIFIERGEAWELRRQTLAGNWLCQLAGPSCKNTDCPTKLFREFSEREIWDNVIIDAADHKDKWLGQMELELVAALQSRLKLLTVSQRRSLLLAIRGHIDKRLATNPDE